MSDWVSRSASFSTLPRSPVPLRSLVLSSPPTPTMSAPVSELSLGPTEQMSCPEHEDDDEKERAGDESPARRGEGVQHVVNCDNEDLTRG